MEQEVVVLAKFVAKKGYENQLKNTLISLIAPTKKEKGCILYHFHSEINHPHVFVFYEIWKNQNYLKQHSETNHFKNTINSIQDLLEKPLEVTFLNQHETTLQQKIDNVTD